jgi:hypothetical protein
MSEPSRFFKALAAFYFRPTPEGQIFIRPSPWVFSRGRAYRLSDVQAAELGARICRGYISGFVVTLLICVLGAAIPIIMQANPETFVGLVVGHPIAAFVLLVVFTLMLIGLVNGIVYRAASSVVAGVPWTRAPREPYDPASNLKKVIALQLGMATALPTTALVILFLLVLIGLPMWAIPAYKALASGQVNAEVLVAPVMLVILFELGVALVVKRRQQRSAKGTARGG